MSVNDTVLMSVDGSQECPNGAFPTGPAPLTDFLELLYSAGEVGLTVMGHQLTRSDSDFQIKSTQQMLFVLRVDEGGEGQADQQLVLNNWCKTRYASHLLESATRMVMKLKYNRRDRQITPTKGWLYLQQSVQLKKDKLLRVL